MELVGRRVRIRRPRLADAEPSFRWFSNPTVTAYLPLASKGFIPLEDVQKFLATASVTERPALNVTVESIRGDVIGCGGFRNFVEGESAEISLIIGEPQYWGKGLGAEAMSLMIGYGFDTLQLEEIWLVVRADNERGIRLFRKLGFQVKETLENAVVIDGVPRDKLKMSLLKSGWKFLDSNYSGHGDFT
jgi:RimJ/RimL family protein N-acetyltransferase